MFDDSEATKNDQACSIDKAEIDNIDNLVDIQVDDDDDVECGSTEEVPEKCFWKIRSCSFVKEAKLSKWNHISDSCFLPDGQVVLCETYCIMGI